MRALQRLAALCLIGALATWLFYIGREHQVFLDNKTIEVEGQSFRALKLARVSVWTDSDGKINPVELMPRDRDLAKAVGPVFHLKLEVMDEFGEEVEKVIEKTLTPGFSKDMMISVPLLAADRSDYILPPPTTRAAPAPDDAAESGAPLSEPALGE